MSSKQQPMIRGLVVVVPTVVPWPLVPTVTLWTRPLLSISLPLFFALSTYWSGYAAFPEWEIL